MLQQYLIASSCMRTHFVVEEHYTGCSEWSALRSFLSVPQYTSDVIVASCCINYTISTPFLPQKTVVISFLSHSVCLNFIGVFGERTRIHCFDCSSVLTFSDEPRLHYLLFVRCDWDFPRHLCYRPKKSQNGSHSLSLILIRENFRNSSCAKLVIA
jgi:hypothetical protein